MYIHFVGIHYFDLITNAMDISVKQDKVHNKTNELKTITVELPQRTEQTKIFTKIKLDGADTRIHLIVVLFFIWILTYSLILWWFVHKK